MNVKTKKQVNVENKQATTGLRWLHGLFQTESVLFR